MGIKELQKVSRQGKEKKQEGNKIQRGKIVRETQQEDGRRNEGGERRGEEEEKGE